MSKPVRWAVVVGVVLNVAGTKASGPDPRLATVRKAYVVPVDDLGDDRAVAVCLAAHLSELTPIATVQSKEEADVVFRVSAHLPSATSRYALGVMGGSPSAHLYAETPSGEKLWDDGAKRRRGNTGTQIMLKGQGQEGSIACGLAEELADTLLAAMRKARGK
jgi:hypothetical protein